MTILYFRPGFAIDRYNNWLLLGCAQVALGCLLAAAPWGGGVVLLACCLVPSGMAAGFYDTGKYFRPLWEIICI